MCALAIGLGFLAFQVLVRGHVPSRRSLAAGLVLGCSNYAATHCLMLALESSGLESSVLFPANNVLTLGVTALAASLIFGERLSAGNVTGLGIAGASLGVMALR
jgi:drug/metabolite transporter (DMT)-like permease